MVDITNIFGGAFTAPATPHIDPPELQLADAMRSAGIEPPAQIRIDGQLHRFSTKGRKRDDSGWYVAFPDEPVAGRFGCWRDQIDCNFRADIGREMTAAEHMSIVRRQSEARARRDEERQRKAEVAADTVQAIWSGAIAASEDHPYLARKGIKPHGVRTTGDGRLIVPLFGPDGDLSSLQYIGEDKRYHPGAATRGCSWTLGDLDGSTIFVAEGFATAATIHEVSNRPVVVAYSANNLPEVVRQLRERHGATQDIVVVADNDASGVGRNKADEASAKHGCRIVMPPIEGDANDYALAGHDLMAILFPPVDDWLIPADDFAAQPAPIRWLVKRWIQSEALIMVHGPSGSGKTFLALDMVLSIASNEAIPDWNGHKVRPGPVVYLAGEGHHGLRGRVAAWKQHRGVGSLNMWLSRHGLDLNSPAGYQKTVEAIRGLGTVPSVIVVDTLHRFLQGDENSAQDAKTMLDACGSIIEEFGCSVVLVHHTGVAAEAQHRARGSSAWKGALDIEISVVPPSDDAPMEVVQRKSKDAELAEPLHGVLTSVEIAGWFDEDGEKVTSAVFEQTDAPAESGGSSKQSSALDRHRKTFERAWWASETEMLGVRPFVSRASLEAKLAEDGLAARTIVNHLNPAYTDRLIGALINADAIQKTEEGWAIIDETWASALTLAKAG
jgi:putative DNA primase/helicase